MLAGRDTPGPDPGDGAHNLLKENQKTAANRHNPFPAMTSADSDSVVARRVAQDRANPAPDAVPDDPDLARVLAAWPFLAGPIRAAVLALVATATTPST
jgi:hypothetical protein